MTPKHVLLALCMLCLTACTVQPVTGPASVPGAESRARRAVELAREALEEGHPEQALDMLAQVQRSEPVSILRDANAVRGQALFRLGRTVDAVRALVDREVWLDDAADILSNQRMIWRGLQEARAPAAATGDRIVDGWLALAPAASESDAEDLKRSLLAWRDAHPDHPAANGLLAELLFEQRAEGFPERIALLLPLGAEQRDAAIAVRDGFLAAHLSAARGSSVKIRVYDTARDSLGAYSRAQVDGAQFIVGPLLRGDVEQVAAKSGLVPTLALNFAAAETPLPRNFYQFALAPEDEARMVARYAAESGASTAVALVPGNDGGYGRRLLNSFNAEFEALGGRLLDVAEYDANAQDFSAPIDSLLHISQSDRRYRRLAANLRTPVEFEPRRRQDIDLIFLAADSRAGRLLAPQLRFHFAGDIPTYATSSIYEPGDPSRNNDLNGVMFSDTPWLLRPSQSTAALRRELESYWPQRASRGDLIRLYGMGFDAYQLVVSLYGVAGPAWPLPGVSGDLTLDRDGRIHRVLPLARFRDGRPAAMDFPDASRIREVAELAGPR